MINGYKVSVANVTQADDSAHYITEASTIGLAVGIFPLWLDTELGNGTQFSRTSLSPIRATYRQSGTNIELVVLND